MKKYKVDVIIPVYNSLEWVKICIDAIIKNTNLEILGKVYLIDDCSNDETRDYLDNMQVKWGELLVVIHNKSNLGFVKTCNKGMKKSTSDYVLLLNTDCIVSKNAIEKMADAMSKDKKIGLLCPISSVASNLSYAIPSGMNFMQVNEVFERQFKGKTFDACTVVGNCLMISRENIQNIGVFDEIFGKGYTEETDYQFKSTSKGFKAKVLIDTYVYHQCRVSFGESEEQLKIRADHLKIFFERWGEQYHKLMEKYQKNNPIDYINKHVNYSNVDYDYTWIVKKEDLEIVSTIVNKMMLEGINIKVVVKPKQLDQYEGIMLYNPVIKKQYFRREFNMRKINKIVLIFLLILTLIVNVQAEEITVESNNESQETNNQVDMNASNQQVKKYVEYTSHVQSYGWLEQVHDGEKSGTEGEAKRMEALKIHLAENLKGNIEYVSHVQSYGWENTWKKNGELTGTEGLAKRLEAIRIRLTGEVSESYDIYYRVHVQTYGWLEWAKNGETAGTIGLAKRIEAVEIKLVEKGTGEETGNSYKQNEKLFSYNSHVQSYGWLEGISSGVTGKIGESKRLEAFKISYVSAEYLGYLQYMSFIEGIGWESSWKRDGNVSGTIGQSKKIEQIKMQLVGEVSDYYDVYYRVHTQGYGWLGWAKNGESAGTEDIGFRIEGLEIKILPKGTGEETGSSLKKKEAYLHYSSHIRRIGDQEVVNEGETTGTTGQSLRMEGIRINVDSEITGNILYKAYIDELGWEENYKSNGELSGTTGQSKGIQLLRIKLDGDLAKTYDVYYRIHTESFGWLDWAKNDEITGADCYDIQAVQVRLYLKIDSNKNSLNTSAIHIETGFYKENGYTYYKDKNGNQATDWIHIMDKKYFFNSLGVMIGKNVKKVMDVSAWQGDIDWDTVKKYGDLDGVILRIAAGCEYEDTKLARNVEALKRLNIPYGIYIYSYAETYNEGKTYADFTIRMIEKYSMNPRIGIFFDLEANGITNYLTTQHYEDLTRGYMDTMYSKGYGNLTRIYTYKSLAEEKLNSPYLFNQITWIAHYNHFNRYVNNNVVGWQYSSQEYVPGVPTLADMSVWFTNF